MDNNNIKEIIEQLTSIELIKSSQIPDIDLYMDQITTLFEEKLKTYKKDENDKLLTKTMINNYTKDGLIPPPVKKKYSKNQIILLIMIYYLKNIISINNIKTILNNIDENNIEKIYNDFINLQEEENKRIEKEILENMKFVTENNEDEKTKKILTALMLINQANIRKILAEKIIENYIK